MTAQERLEITDQTRLIDLTVADLKHIIHNIVKDIVEQAVFELEQQLPDPDEGKEFTPEFAEQLRQSLDDRGELKSIDEVQRELGLDE